MFATDQMLQHETRRDPPQAREAAPAVRSSDQSKGRFEQVVLPHLDAAYNLARWLTRNDHDAQDIVQDAMLRAFRFFDGLRGEPKPWLLAIVRNCCFTWLQANRPADTVAFNETLAELLPSEDDGPEALAVRNSDRKMLNTAIDTLPAPFREVLILRELEDLSYKDIARIAEVPIGTVMSRLARARRMLADSLRATHNISRTQVHK